MNTTNNNAKIKPFSERVYNFFSTHRFPIDTPVGVQALNPYQDPQTLVRCKLFWDQFYISEAARVSVWGINPGRLGGGLTGIAFTDPVLLHRELGLPTIKGTTTPELSAQFIWKVIERFGGALPFFSSFYLTSLCPLGFVKDGKNYNFYDDKHFAKNLEGYINSSVEQQISWGLRTDGAVCLGKGKLFSIMQQLNERYQWFTTIYPLEHPRFILQYRRSSLEQYLEEYVSVLTRISSV